MIEKMYSKNLDEKFENFLKEKNNLLDIIKELQEKIKFMETYNNTFYSQASVEYCIKINNEIIRINEFINTLGDCINYLTQVKNNYIVVDNEAIRVLEQIGSVKE